MKALLNRAVKRHIIPASPFKEKITFADVLLPELELSDEERVAFLAAFDDEQGFRADVATRLREAHIMESEHFSTPRRFGFGPNPESETTGQRFAAFRALKPVFVVALETGLRNPISSTCSESKLTSRTALFGCS